MERDQELFNVIKFWLFSSQGGLDPALGSYQEENIMITLLIPTNLCKLLCLSHTTYNENILVFFTLKEQKMRRLELIICNSYHVRIQDLIDCSSRESFHHFVKSSMSNYGHGKDEKFCDGKNCSLLKSKAVLIQLQVFI